MYTNKDLGLVLNLNVNLFLRTFLEFILEKKIDTIKIIKRILPTIIFFLPSNIIEMLFGIIIFQVQK